MGYTADKVPLVGEAPGQKGLWICAGFHGHGESSWPLRCVSKLTVYRYGPHVSVSRSVGWSFDGKGEGGGRVVASML